MNKIIALLGILTVLLISSFYQHPNEKDEYLNYYQAKVLNFNKSQSELLSFIIKTDLSKENDVEILRERLHAARLELKGIDFWLRYLEPIAYKQINGPLAVEWETEVFEKFEQPYKRVGGGLTLAELLLDENPIDKDSLIKLIELSKVASETFFQDSITQNLRSYHHFFLSNRLYLLNLAAIYTTGFECPDKDNIVPELSSLMLRVTDIYKVYNKSYPSTPLSNEYLKLYNRANNFLTQQSADYKLFNHFDFIKHYINPLFSLNQEMIRDYRVISSSYNDFSLNNSSTSLFDKSLYSGQNPKGIYYSITDEKVLQEIKETGKILFYDPILSGNAKRSCASCHKPAEFFTDTVVTTSLHFDQKKSLTRNTPTLTNVVHNHLINLDGKHFNLQEQAKDVILSLSEMGAPEEELLKRILSCEDYKKSFKKYAALTPLSKTISLDHIVSAITLYYNEFSMSYSPFDDAINNNQSIDQEVITGFNLFMGKAECGTCHFVPQFNGVKPPYVGSEFEILGVPRDKTFKAISPDVGRFTVFPAKETRNAFRTGTVRNTFKTKPYMHNGIFDTLDEVIDFYNAGGGAGRSLSVGNQTLSADSLKLSAAESKAIIEFIKSLTEKIDFPKAPDRLPVSNIKSLNNRKVGGEY